MNIAQHADETLYEVFGRITPTAELTHIGSIRAPNDDLAIIRARSICGTRFHELCLAPAHQFIAASKKRDDVAVKEF